MTPERWKHVDRVLQDALEVEGADRESFLTRVCAGDDELRQEVESLLAFHTQAESFIEAPPGDIAADWHHANDSRAGQVLGHYHLIRQVGRGGMGEVYLARDTRLGRRVALKLLPPRFTEDEQRVQRFQQEARAASALNHPNIITIHEIGEVATETGKVRFIATEFIEGQTLRVLINNGAMKPAEALEVTLQAASALAAAHATGIIHRDIKPENIMLRPDGYVKVLDFGLAKLNEHSRESALARFDEVETDPGMVLGTVSYMSPEQARGQETDARSDTFSLGVVLYEMLTSVRPFVGGTAADMVASLLSQAPRPLSEFDADTHPELQNLISRMLAKEPADRYQSTEELRQALKIVKKELAPADEYSTREFSGLSLLVQKLNRSGAGGSGRPRGAEIGAPTRITSSISFLITRFIRSPKPIVLTVLSLAIVITGLALGKRWLERRAPRIESIAVLPFKPLLSVSRDEALEIGLADSLIARLGSVQSLSVPPLSAVRRYAAIDQDPVAAGRELKTQAVLESSIHRADERIRVTSRLISIPDGKLLWTRQFDERWTDIFAVQDAIAERVAGDLIAPLTGEERTELTRQYTGSPAAYRLYLEGRYYWNKRTGDGMRKAVEYFKQAIENDPKYALAYVGLADAYATLGSYRVSPPRETLSRAHEAAAEALRLDQGLAEAHATMGKILTDFDWDWERAEKEFQLAIKLKPNYPNSHHWYSTLLAHLGRFDEAVAEANRALELDYLSPAASTQLGQILYRARRYDESIRVLRQTLDREPNFITARLYVTLCYLVQDRYEEALEEVSKARALVGNQGDVLGLMGQLYGHLGRRDEALKLQEELTNIAKRTYVSPFTLSAIPFGLGKKDEVFRWLDRCFEERDPSIRGLKTDPLFDDLRDDPRFEVLMRRAGFTR